MELLCILIYDSHGYMTVNICQNSLNCGPQRMNLIMSKNTLI